MPDPTAPPARARRTRARSTSTKAAAQPPSPDLPETLVRRVIVEQVRPEIDAGRFPIKRTPGDAVEVTAAIHADGHDLIDAVVRYRLLPSGAPPQEVWNEVPMTLLGNDIWAATFTVGEIGWAEYTVEAWIDAFGSWRKGLAAKFDAQQDVSSELLEGAQILRGAAARSPERDWLLGRAERLASSAPQDERVHDALDPRVAELARASADRSRATRYDRVLRVLVHRERARFGSWYEMFPRSAGTDPRRSATFREAEGRLADIAAMGFDVLYLPPIHPIGRTFRKGPNNTLTAGPTDPGSPWAIGGPEGGHMSVHPDLGTLDDFAHFVEAAKLNGLEVALDLAYQCSPDHPYVREHPEWFRHRPDGTIKYAENPPKKYQDIYPFDFECDAWRSLWHELKRVVEFWCERGVRIFRVDNPHTKAFRFWEWMIGDVRQRYPDTIFLSEAFTRPHLMRYLAKLGFDQSYSYFTWRNTRDELTEYFTELTTTEVREYMRANLFANTPDILHEYLQHGGPGAFRIRLVLAATLGASYGIYSGYELCENVPVRPGSEEYLDSEKYQVRVRDWNAPGNIKPLVTRVNQIRREHPALQHDRGLQFTQCDNPHIIAYLRSSPDERDLLLVVVSLDSHNMQHGFVQVPVWRLDADATGGFPAHDLLTGTTFPWRGEWNYVRLDPQIPAHIIRLPARAGVSAP